MKAKSRIRIAVSILLIISYVLIALYFLMNSGKEVTKTKDVLGIMVILISIPYIFMAHLFSEHKKWEKIFYYAMLICGIALGIIFITVSDLSLDTICLIWGIADIIRNAIEVICVLDEIKKDKIAIIDMICSIVELIFDVLLCIHLYEGLQLHLIAVAITLFISAIKRLYEFILLIIYKKKNQLL